MIIIDPRRGSGELERLFLPYGVTIRKQHLDFGDFSWTGKGPGGCQCSVVAERKQIDDLIQSMQSRRLSGHQLPGMAENYDYGYLIVEGTWRRGSQGQLEVNRNGRWYPRSLHVRALNNYLMGLSLRAGLVIWPVYNDRETVAFVVDQHEMWQKPWEDHKAHDVVYAPADPTGEKAAMGRRLSLRMRKVTYAEKFAMQLPGIDARARDLAQEFGSGQVMGNMTIEQWQEVKGIGKKMAERIVRAWQEIGF